MRFAIALTALAAFATAQGGINNSAHNFSNAGWNTTKQGQTCGVCHIPHVEGRPASRTTSATLWGRELSSATYTMYFGYGIRGAADTAPSGSTRLCLGCHDGSVALELFHTTTTGSTFIGTDARIPGRASFNFGSDHPISIRYADGQDPLSATINAGLRVRTTAWPTGGTIADVLEGGKVQCVSCHDVHNIEVEATAGNLLRVKNNGRNGVASALCLACHIK